MRAASSRQYPNLVREYHTFSIKQCHVGVLVKNGFDRADSCDRSSDLIGFARANVLSIFEFGAD
jgi:hypothetical protein